MNIHTSFEEWDDGDVTIHVYIDYQLRFTGTYASEEEAREDAQKWLDDAYPDSGKVI